MSSMPNIMSTCHVHSVTDHATRKQWLDHLHMTENIFFVIYEQPDNFY